MNSAVVAVSPVDRSKIEVAEVREDDGIEWDAFVDAHPAGTFFHLFRWRQLLSETVGFAPQYLLARRDGRVVGVLPMMLVRSLLFGNSLVSLPFCVEAGILAEDEPALRTLLDAARRRAEDARVGYLELRHSARRTDDLLCKEDVYVNFKRALAPTVDDNMKAIPRKQRAVVRKGIAAGLVSRIERNLDAFFPIYAASVRNLGTPVFPRRYFEGLLAAFGDRVEITTVYHGDMAVASVMSFLYRNTVMPYYGGGLPVARDVKAYDFMYWEVMRRACESGLAAFDYGRSKVDSGSYSFKKNWGFEPSPLHYEYHLVTTREMPNRNPNNPKFALAVRAWKHLPLPLANLIGPYLSPYLA